MVINSQKAEPVLNNPVADKVTAAAPEKPATPPIPSAQPIVKLVKLSPASISSSCDTVSSNQEQIVEKAKQVTFTSFSIPTL